MYNPATRVTKEPNAVLELGSRIGRFTLDTSSFLNLTSEACSPASLLSNYLSFNNLTRVASSSKRTVSLSLNNSGGGYKFRNILHDFNRAVRVHCERMPIGFASLRVGDGGDGGGGGGVGEGNDVGGNGNGVGVEDEGLGLKSGEGKKAKKVLILMSDTGGGHRASAEAIKAAFYQEYGDDYQVFITDLWSEHTPWPFNQIPKSYSFLVKHGPLWRMTYYGTAPRLVHQSNFAATSTFIAREVAKGLMKYQPDIIISVHPLMQHVPLRILRSRGLLDKIVFTTVITDLSTCHPTWFHKLVTRCYCPTTDVAKRAMKAGLQQTQIKIYGLPVRPSFIKPVRPKVKGFVTKIEECMGACDCIITKAGPGTIAEAMIRGLPIILNDYIAGQEAGNVSYVVENGCGKYSKLPKEIAKIVADWFGPKADELKEMSQNALKLARPDSVFRIVHDMHELVKQRSLLREYSCTA
ncbi:probable monogalactosyldiacylglycerol synthase, chloroplastic isoform X2 [Medicago truncatula]|uniref:probable monogalactosyldiacylglycerol synthase, chloroplastic isoform X2 n=1 Tax=Medicago truncatula TaxID=3880 RepID=UPI00196709AC|nr:probable monogalactosyldiacylglycerol synthase, chloroplastic isoform X2 [Medicago truncatula]